MKRIDLTGQLFGDLKVVGFSRPGPSGSFWNCECSCGSTKEVRSKHLRDGKVASCGCKKGGWTHGFTSKSSRDEQSLKETYRSWVGMRQRCLQEKHRFYRFYGGRGITFSAEWDDFPTFLQDMGVKPKGTTLGRIDNDGMYCKENCRWESKIQQERNKSTTRWVEYNGVRRSLSEWCELYGLPFHVVHYRLKSGWGVERALTTPKANRSR